jgi:hypothetical protein
MGMPFVQRTKKLQERRYLERFKTAFSAFPSGTIEASEAPDFLIKAAERTIGIEITELFHDLKNGKSLMREQEGLQAQVIDRAQQLFRKANPAHLFVTVNFDTPTKLTKARTPILAEELVNIVLSGVHDYNQHEVLSFDGDDNDLANWPDELAFLNVLRQRESSRWVDCCAGFAPRCRPEDIQGRLDEKQPKLSKYRQICDEVWLLIVLYGCNQSSMMDLGAELTAHQYKLEFDRAFLLENFDGRVIEFHK